ncbi:MAG: HAD hydrolase-like protein, partial [bacterium]
GLQWTPKKEDKFKKVYFEYLKSEIKKPNARKHIEPGISALLDLLGHQPDITLGLLTGNWRRGGRIKLEYFKLFHYFQIGAFADDSEMREKLPAIACRRFEQKLHKKIQPQQVFIIGDTPLDVACAKPFGAKSVAVATGFFSYAELNAAKPDYLFTDLSDSQEFLQIFNERN